MSRLWTPELLIDEPLARQLVAAQFPQFAGTSIRRFGSGWDNAAFLLDERVVFRFPQRAIAAPLLVKELATLPRIADRLPKPVPKPIYAGRPYDRYPWHFAGYEVLRGATACSRDLSDDERHVLATDLGTFLRALHGIDVAPLRADGLPDDVLGKLAPKRLGLDEPPLDGGLRVVHGDLYARHLLLDDDNRLCGVIDWGDLHAGLPAVDLSVVHMLVPPRFHGAFFAAYGPVDERAWHFARARARCHAAFTLEYAQAVGDRALEAACATTAAFSAL
ncbi:MAG TPA: phosphotransferase [Candidatus Aquilonibacter sp.]